MPKSASIVLAVLVGVSGQAVQAHATGSAPRHAIKPESGINIVLSQASYVETRGPVATCANFAAVRALMAKASGSDFAIQSRVLNVSFLLCMHDRVSSD